MVLDMNIVTLTTAEQTNDNVYPEQKKFPHDIKRITITGTISYKKETEKKLEGKENKKLKKPS